MKKFNGLNIEEVSLETACTLINGLDKNLSLLLTEWQPDKSYTLYKVKYAYGKKVMHQGKLQLPLNDGTTVAFDDPIIPNSIRADLSYSSFPIGIILNNSAEVFVELETRIISLAIFEPGVPLGLLETLESPHSFCFRNVWTVTAGARTGFMLAKISDKFYHTKLQRALGCELPPPRTPSEHTPVFIDIINKYSDIKDWEVEFLFFSKKWFEVKHNDIHWTKFYSYLQSYLILYTGFSRNRPKFELIWDYFSEKLYRKKKKSDPIIFDKLKSLLISALGVIPLYSPAIDDTRGPITEIQKIYCEIYGLQYAPTIMVPRHFGFDKYSLPAYFSLKHHTTFINSPRNKDSESLITGLTQLNSLLRDFLEFVENGKLNLKNTTIENMIEATNFNFYHIDSKDYKNIYSTKSLPISDPMLCKQLGNDTIFDFPYTNTFLRSCIQLSKKNDIEIIKEINVIN
jgi:hypothetical protein